MARLGPCLGNASQVAEEEKKMVLIERSHVHNLARLSLELNDLLRLSSL